MREIPFRDFELLDCTIRDGGYLNDWMFDRKLVRETYRALSKAGVDYIEIGYRGTEKYFDMKKYGIWRFSAEEDIKGTVANIDGARLALMSDYGKVEPRDFCDAKDSAVKLIRVASNKDKLREAVALLSKIKKKGYKVSLNAMGYTNYSKVERDTIADIVRSSELDYIYVADSYGSMFPDQIKSIFEPLLELSNVKIGFHPHNNLQMAFANALEAINCGVHIIDSTVYGMGRAAGNLPTEIIISFLERKIKDRYNSIPVLNLIDRYFTSLEKENKWGYQLPYMLSGMFTCHPNYAKMLVDLREYTIEDIWKAMSYIAKNNPAGFSKPLLNKLISEGVLRDLAGTQNGRFSQKNEERSQKQIGRPSQEVTYVERYKGSNVLILANGPTLKGYKDKIDKFIEKYDPVILGANYIGSLFSPHYHAFNNKRRFASYVDTVMPQSKLLIGQYIPDEMVREYVDRDYEKIYYRDVLDADFDIEEGVIATNCRTISVLLIGVAIVMGAERIFAVGMDGYDSAATEGIAHFYEERYEVEDRGMIIERHHWCQRFLAQIDEYLHRRGKEGIHILTPTSYRAFYKGIENYL